MTTFLLVRHGAHDWLGRGLAGRLGDVSLNAAGWLQAEALVQRLEGQAIDAIYSSPQPRARQTVAPLAGHRRLKVRVEPAFDEIDFGRWTGCEFASLADDGAWHEWNAHRSKACAPGGEAFAAVRERAVAGLEQLRMRHPDGCVLVASHGDVIKTLVATVLRMSLDDLESFDVAPASLTRLQAEDGWQQLLLLNRVDAA